MDSPTNEVKLLAFPSHFHDIVTLSCFILQVLIIWDFNDNYCLYYKIPISIPFYSAIIRYLLTYEILSC